MTGRADATVPVIYDCAVAHHRPSPIKNRFRYGSYLWFVDIDHLPRFRWPLGSLARFRSDDHLEDTFDHGTDHSSESTSLRTRVDAYLAGHGIDLEGGMVTMLTSARVLGYVFNPLTVFWCHRPNGEIACVIAEVHNTYGQRHSYLLHTDPQDRVTVDKDFYVSPFEPVAGHYDMRLPEPGERLSISITLHRDGQDPFVASISGTPRPGTARELVRAALRHPVAPLVATLRIRRQGIALWMRGLAVTPRPPTQPGKASP